MSTSIGEQLRQAREARLLTLEQVARATHIRVHYLNALEAGDFTALPSAAQARGFLRAYAGFLGLDAESLLREFGEATTPRDPPTSPVLQPASTPSPSGSVEADQIFAELGRTLKQRRELLGLSLEDVERHTHLRRHYLRALEAGDLEGLPSPVQGRGMLNNYAIFLGLNSEQLLLRFAEGLQVRLAAKQAARQDSRPVSSRTQPAPPSALRRLFSGDVLIGVTVTLFLLFFVVWGTLRIFAVREEQPPQPTAPSIAEVLLASPTASLSPTPAPVTPTSASPPITFETQFAPTGEAAAALPATSPGNVQVYITVLQRAWMRVTVDGEVQFEGRVIPGSAYTFTGDSQVEVLTGNGAGLQVFYNQQNIGLLGEFGQVVNRIFTPQEILLPTPTITMTPTATLPPTATLKPSATPRPGQVTPPPLP